MDLLHTCYQSYMRLYPDDPDRLTLGRWVWCPEGAEYLPFDHAFQSSKWDPDSWRVDPDIGEVRGLAGYSSGKITPRFTGRNFCGAVILYQEGSPLELMGTPAVDAEGVPLCCNAPPAVGGLAMGGQGIASSWEDVGLWLRPEELTGFSEGDTVPSWPAAPGTPRAGTSAGDLVATYHTDSATGRGGLMFTSNRPHNTIFTFPSLPLPTDLTTYVVARGIGPVSTGAFLSGGSGDTIAPGMDFFRIAVEFQPGTAILGPLSPPRLNMLLITSAWRSGHTIGLVVNNFPSGTLTFPTAPAASLDTLQAGGVHTGDLGLVWIAEVIAFARRLSPAEDAAVMNYLTAKYTEEEPMLTGSILAYAGPSLPTGYLVCDGSEVSRTTFAALFTAIGETWGAGDGSTTFNLPDLQGRSGIGAGAGGGLSLRTLAELGGEEEHQLDVPELASHLHGINDPGHGHSVNSGNSGVTVDNTAPLTTVSDFSGSLTSLNSTNITVNNEGGNLAHNTMHPFAVVQYLIKT